MATLYAITKGDYSDYHIITLTANKEKAERIAKLYSDSWCDTKIEVFEDGDPNDTRTLYYVCLKADGSSRVDIASEYSFNEPQNKIKKVKYRAMRAITQYEVFVLADDEDHALKIARDLLAESRYRKEIEEVL